MDTFTLLGPPFTGLTLISTMILDYIHYNAWGEISYLFPNLNSATIEVLEWISNFTPYFAGHVIKEY